MVLKKIKRKIIKNNLVEKKFAFLDTYSFKGKKSNHGIL